MGELNNRDYFILMLRVLRFFCHCLSCFSYLKYKNPIASATKAKKNNHLTRRKNTMSRKIMVTAVKIFFNIICAFNILVMGSEKWVVLVNGSG